MYTGNFLFIIITAVVTALHFPEVLTRYHGLKQKCHADFISPPGRHTFMGFEYTVWEYKLCHGVLCSSETYHFTDTNNADSEEKSRWFVLNKKDSIKCYIYYTPSLTLEVSDSRVYYELYRGIVGTVNIIWMCAWLSL